MDREEIKSFVVGPIATVPTPFDDDFEVDYATMADLTQWWVEGGLVKGRAVIKVAAAMGEGPQLRDEEWPELLRTAVRAADDKAAIMCGLHYKDTIRTIEDAKKAQDLGAIGLQISPPVLNGPTQDDIVRHFGDVSDAIDIGFLAYVTRGMPGSSIYPETFKRMVDFEHVVAIKWGVPAENKYEDIFELGTSSTSSTTTERPSSTTNSAALGTSTTRPRRTLPTTSRSGTLWRTAATTSLRRCTSRSRTNGAPSPTR